MDIEINYNNTAWGNFTGDSYPKHLDDVGDCWYDGRFGNLRKLDYNEVIALREELIIAFNKNEDRWCMTESQALQNLLLPRRHMNLNKIKDSYGCLFVLEEKFFIKGTDGSVFVDGFDDKHDGAFTCTLCQHFDIDVIF